MKDNKKKLVILALAVLIVGIGAFQFMGGSSAPAPTKGDAKKADPSASATATPEAVKNPLYAQALSQRDPFEIPAEAQPTPTPAPTPPPQPMPQKPRPRGTERIAPLPLTGDLPPANGGPMGAVGGPNGATAAKPPEPEFGYKVVGVVVGAKPVAVFSDAQGNQRLVPLGGSLDPDTTVSNIEKGKVTLKFHGKTIRFQMEGK